MNSTFYVGQRAQRDCSYLLPSTLQLHPTTQKHGSLSPKLMSKAHITCLFSQYQIDHNITTLLFSPHPLDANRKAFLHNQASRVIYMPVSKAHQSIKRKSKQSNQYTPITLS